MLKLTGGDCLAAIADIAVLSALASNGGLEMHELLKLLTTMSDKQLSGFLTSLDDRSACTNTPEEAEKVAAMKEAAYKEMARRCAAEYQDRHGEGA